MWGMELSVKEALHVFPVSEGKLVAADRGDFANHQRN